FIIIIVSSFFFTAPPPTQFYSLSLHDALPIFEGIHISSGGACRLEICPKYIGKILNGSEVLLIELLHLLQFGNDFLRLTGACKRDRKSTRLNSSHVAISYAVFCLKKKKQKITK